jgi:hypothetical protein
MRQVTAADTLVQNSRALVSGIGSLIHEGLGFAGRAAEVVAHDLSARLRDNKHDGQVLPAPACSDYRVTQLERAEANYRKMLAAFWNTGSIEGIKKQIDVIAHDKGVSVDKVVDEMKPGGVLGALGDRFKEAVKTEPEARKNMRLLDQALESFIRQYKYGVHELSGTHNAQNREQWRKRIEDAKDKMLEMTSTVPKASEEGPSHFEKLQAVIQAIAEKLREIFASLFSRAGAKQESDRAPSP